jgi:hypothetical protein
MRHVSPEDDALKRKRSSPVSVNSSHEENRMVSHEYAISVDCKYKNINRPGNMEFNLVEQILCDTLLYAFFLLDADLPHLPTFRLFASLAIAIITKLLNAYYNY